MIESSGSRVQLGRPPSRLIQRLRLARISYTQTTFPSSLHSHVYISPRRSEALVGRQAGTQAEIIV